MVILHTSCIHVHIHHDTIMLLLFLDRLSDNIKRYSCYIIGKYHRDDIVDMSGINNVIVLQQLLHTHTHTHTPIVSLSIVSLVIKQVLYNIVIVLLL